MTSLTLTLYKHYVQSPSKRLFLCRLREHAPMARGGIAQPRRRLFEVLCTYISSVFVEGFEIGNGSLHLTPVANHLQVASLSRPITSDWSRRSRSTERKIWSTSASAPRPPFKLPIASKEICLLHCNLLQIPKESATKGGGTIPFFTGIGAGIAKKMKIRFQNRIQGKNHSTSM